MCDKIKFYSTNLKATEVTFSEALLKGLAPDRGLYMPKYIPKFTDEEIFSFREKEYYEIAFEVVKKFLVNEIPEDDLLNITKDAYDFEVPVEKVYERKYIMRLDRGPTASFKDFAARMMGRLMNYYLKKENKNLTILTATSGDTGSAIANAFYGLDNIKAVVLFPEDEVTKRQRKQMTTLGKNVQSIAINGKFDDCQHLVKQAFSDPDLNYMNLSSANSINIGRLLPQIVYYFYAWSKLSLGIDDKIIFCVPSGNFGNIMGGMLAKNMGLPVKRFVIATNANDEFPKFIETKQYNKIEPSINCISSAMNVGHPSNLARLIALYDGVMDEKGNISKFPNFKNMHNDIFSISISDAQTRSCIKETYAQYGVLLEPHGAVGWAALNKYLEKFSADRNPNQLCVSLETAHPAKFPEEIQKILSLNPDIPESLKGLEELQESFVKLEKGYEVFKNFLKEK